jgi:dienelactone hydrolase
MPVSVNVTLSNPAQTVSYTLPSGVPASSVRELVVGVYAPNQPGDYPVIVYSHGHGGSSVASQGAGLTAQALADLGYIVLMPNHLDSIALYPDWIRSQFTVHREASGLHRAADMQFVLTQAATLVGRLPPDYTADLSAPVAAGHSNGAFTSAVLGGLTTGLADYDLQPGNPYGLTSVTDARFTAMVLISPQGQDTSWAGLEQSAWANISIPTLIITGDEDDEPLGGPGRWEGRLDAFRHSDHAATLALVYRGAGHDDIGGNTTIPGLTASITATIDRFLEGWLRDDTAALATLNDPAALLETDPFLFQAFARAVADTRGQGAIDGASAGERLTGLQSDDIITGGAGDDLISGGLGNDRIDGGGGNDILTVSGSSSGYRLLRSGDDFILKGPDGRDTLTNVERILFGDGRVLELNRIYGPDDAGSGCVAGFEQPEAIPSAEEGFQLTTGFGGPLITAAVLDVFDLSSGGMNLIDRFTCWGMALGSDGLPPTPAHPQNPAGLHEEPGAHDIFSGLHALW